MTDTPTQTDDDGTDIPTVSFGRLFGLARPHLTPILVGTALMLVMSLIGLAVPKLAGDVVDTALTEATRSDLRNVVVLLIGLFAVIGVLGFIEMYLLGLAGARLLLDLRSQLFRRLVYLSPAFYDTRRIGELLSRLGSDLAVVQGSITSQIPAGMQALLRFVGTLTVLFVLHTRLTLVALLVVPPVVLIAILVGTRLERLATRERDSTADTSALAEEVLAGVRTVQSSAAESRSFERYGLRLDRLYRVQLRNTRLQAAFAGLVTFAGFSSFALVLGYGGQLMLEEQLTPGELTSFLLYTFSIAMSVGQLGGLYTGYRKLKGASARLFELLDTESDVEDPALGVPPAAPFQVDAGAVHIDDVTFGYASGSGNALNGVSLDISAGKMVALVGPSGSGKSTLFSMLLHFYDAASGSISIDGRALESIGLGDLRRSIGVVSQEVFLFSGTIADNLRLGAPDADESTLRAGLRAAGALEFVEDMPKGLHTEIGERGLRLSGGQRQRLAIARAFLEDPRILLLDEPTSSLDPDSEAIVQDALERLFEGRTTLVIAHRLATARRASEIHVLDGGRIVASGTHDELIESSELYERYWTLQSLESAPESDPSGE